MNTVIFETSGFMDHLYDASLHTYTEHATMTTWYHACTLYSKILETITQTYKVHFDKYVSREQSGHATHYQDVHAH